MRHATEKHVWFMRHGQPDFDYDNCGYESFIDMLSNGHKKPLLRDHGIDLASLPKSVELICHSPIRRAVETAEELGKNINAKSFISMESLKEVAFDRDIISRKDYKSIPDSRPHILKQWVTNQNKAESFEASMARVRRIESFLEMRPERSIIFITHGWFLRLLQIYFVQGKREGITLSDLLGVEPVELGHCIEATYEPKSLLRPVDSQVGLLL